ncbi:hypothetical protein MC885_001168 [Smutsia gigantea]|nr:hypothetical protein MC885_001168 [Smutsia gigantea]
MDSKDDSSHVWPTSAEHEENAAQVHFVPDAGTVAQIVYTDDQVRPPQQVVYTADGASYTSVDGPEHTLTLFTDPGQVAYVQQDATAQQQQSFEIMLKCLSLSFATGEFQHREEGSWYYFNVSFLSNGEKPVVSLPNQSS